MKPWEKLREILREEGGKALIIPHADEWQNEYLPPFAERLAAATGFTGSAGCAVIGLEKAVLLTDGRYQLQAKDQVDLDFFDIAHSGHISLIDWIEENIQGEGFVFIDPKCHSVREFESLSKLNVNFTCDNWVDRIWEEKPTFLPSTPFDMDPRYIDVSFQDKKRLILRKMTTDFLIITSPESLCWLTNQRGSDIPHTPVFLGFGILSLQGEFKVFSLASLEDVLTPIRGKKVSIDPSRCSLWIRQILEMGNNEILHQEDLCLLPKACKTPSELDGMRDAHKADAIAMIEFLALLEQEIKTKSLTEIESSDLLLSHRKGQPSFLDLSFATISGADENGAIIHYKVNPKTCGTITKDSIYLLDSGGQYTSGTTDITRTMAFKEDVALEIKDAYTAVLKGVIALSRAKFPKGVTGHRLDTLARYHLWQAGLDYDHGTGHGVGCVLSVHEGPQSISSRHNPVPLMEGMVVSIEPGYYKPGAFGIRIENLAIVVASLEPGYLKFETLTLVPINQKLINFDTLETAEKEWLKAYHERIIKEIAPHLSDMGKTFLADYV